MGLRDPVGTPLLLASLIEIELTPVRNKEEKEERGPSREGEGGREGGGDTHISCVIEGEITCSICALSFSTFEALLSN